MRKKEVHIHVGDLHASREPVIIQTLLGSCLAVCLYDPEACMGGMNHILLPGAADLKHYDATARYGVNAMELLINRLMRLGGKRDRFVAKAFGGAHILPAISRENGAGRKNIDFVLKFLEIEKIPLAGYDLGGFQARRVRFHTDTGDVWAKRIKGPTYTKLSQAERQLLDSIKRLSSKEGPITLFT